MNSNGRWADDIYEMKWNEEEYVAQRESELRLSL